MSKKKKIKKKKKKKNGCLAKTGQDWHLEIEPSKLYDLISPFSKFLDWRLSPPSRKEGGWYFGITSDFTKRNEQQVTSVKVSLMCDMLKELCFNVSNNVEVLKSKLCFL